MDEKILENEKKLKKEIVSIRYWLLGKEFYTALRAMEFAMRYHTGKRKDGVTPEFSHQIKIVHYIRTLMPHLIDPETTLIVIFLHDLIEDYGIARDTLKRMFGEKASHAVWLLSKSFKGGKKELLHYFDEMADFSVASIGKGCDRIHNNQTMSGVFTVEKQMEYIEETEEYIFPMLKKARRKFPEQEGAYENIKQVLRSQIELIKIIHKERETKCEILTQ